jgi:hypothetical protein
MCAQIVYSLGKAGFFLSNGGHKAKWGDLNKS